MTVNFFTNILHLLMSQKGQGQRYTCTSHDESRLYYRMMNGYGRNNSMYMYLDVEII